MKILYVIDHLQGGGAEQQFVHIVNNVQVNRCVYLTHDKGIRCKGINKDIPILGGYGKRTPLTSIKEIINLIEEFHPDIIHSFLMYSCFVCALAIKASRHKPFFICQEFSSPEDILGEVRFRSFKKYLIKWTYKMAHQLITTSDKVKEKIVRERYINSNRIKVIPEGILLSRYGSLPAKGELRKRLGFPEEGIYIIFAGSLVERKGLRYLIKAFTEIKNENLKLLIIGEGKMKLEFQRMSCDDRIEFLGYKENAVEYIKAADILVLPSFHEGLPNVLLEAMAVGTPVIATNVSGIPELIEDGVNGLLIPPRNSDALKKAIARLIADIHLAKEFVRSSLEKVKFYKIEVIVQTYKNLYKEFSSK